MAAMRILTAKLPGSTKRTNIWLPRWFLKKVGCDMAQGYLYERPAPMEELEGKPWQDKAGGFHG